MEMFLQKTVMLHRTPITCRHRHFSLSLFLGGNEMNIVDYKYYNNTRFTSLIVRLNYNLLSIVLGV